MKNKWSLLLFLLASTAAIQLVFAQDPLGPQPKKPRTPDDYKPGTLMSLTSVSRVETSRTNKEETILVYGDILPTRVRVRYTGLTREIPQNKQEVLRKWAQLYAGAPETYTTAYEKEMLFTEEGVEHWLAVRKELLPDLKKQLRKPQAVDLYLIRVGATLVSPNWETMLLVERFEKAY